MANTRTVGASGKNHTTVDSALTWFETAAANHTFGSDGIGTIQVEDASQFSEELNINDLNGTTDSTSYLYIIADSASRHAGVFSSSKAGLSKNPSASAVVTISEDYTYIEHMIIELTGTDSSDEGIRITSGTTNVLVSRTIIKGPAAGDSQDGIYAGNWAMSAFIDNCVVTGFGRGGIHAQNFSGSGVQTWNVAHCSLANCGGDDSDADDGGIVHRDPGGSVTTMTAWNNCVADSNGANSSDYQKHNANGTFTAHTNLASDGSIAIKTSDDGTNQASRAFEDETQSSGDFWVVNVTTSGSENLLLLDEAAGNDAISTAFDRIGGEAEARQDFSTDIIGVTRPTSNIDMGCNQFSSAATAALTGTAADTIDEADIVTGGKTIILTLTNDTFKAAGTGPIGTTAQSEALLAGIDSAQSEGAGWDIEVKANFVTGDLVRTSSTVATITIGAESGYDITAQETIEAIIPTDVLVTAAGAITATPTFTIDVVASGPPLGSHSLLGMGR